MNKKWKILYYDSNMVDEFFIFKTNALNYARHDPYAIGIEKIRGMFKRKIYFNKIK